MNEKHTFVHFLLVILFSVVTCIVYWPVRCPSRCTCVPDAIEDELLEVTCKWSRTASKAQPLANFPRNITKILSLECDSDFSSELSDDLFAGFSNLQILKIQNCAVAILPSHLFRGLSALRSLYLYQMALNDLPLTIAENLFDDLRRLEKLSIIDSHVYSFPEGSLCTVPNLQVLNMSHNWLTSANIGFTPNCSSNQVIIVDFSHNRISAIRSSDLNAFPIVHHLSVSNNQISEVDDDAFHLNTVLQNFDASNNQIDKVPNLPGYIIGIMTMVGNALEGEAVTERYH
ncbi:hypothetical protein AB6A40_000448 [Gnathostoma spinigerum]|uniref:Uncharacterized protein n=1 Tax=Gnathostoma spinigerum TaxID=75299 RepID=A0ABD6E250_9BILA